jgi:hypothetical protein
LEHETVQLEPRLTGCRHTDTLSVPTQVQEVEGDRRRPHSQGDLVDITARLNELKRARPCGLGKHCGTDCLVDHEVPSDGDNDSGDDRESGEGEACRVISFCSFVLTFD